MSRIIIIVLAVVAVFVLSFAVMALIRTLTKNKIKKVLYVVLSVVLSLVILTSSMVLYVNIHYAADGIAVETLASDSSVSITKADNGYFFDGKGDDSLFVFYQGAKVDCEAYAPLMQKIASQGVDCFLISSPLRLSIMNLNPIGLDIINNYEYQSYVFGGHSMGGVAASVFAADNPESVSGVVLLAAYPSKKMDEKTSTLSIYGSNDGVLNMEQYNSAKQYLPQSSEELIIEGGNHSGFGNYGEQRGDNTANISNDEQQRQTAAAVVDFCKTIKDS